MTPSVSHLAARRAATGARNSRRRRRRTGMLAGAAVLAVPALLAWPAAAGSAAGVAGGPAGSAHSAGSAGSTATAARAAALGFADVTARAGIRYSGISWGAAWGDLNGDGWPDVATSNHFQPNNMWVNRRDGTFADQGSVFPFKPPTTDTHGGSWGDYDNDGRLDFFQAVGNANDPAEPNHLLHNTGGAFADVSAPAGVDDPLAAGRGPLWLDLDNDGRLDLLLPTHQRGEDGAGATAAGAADVPGAPSALFRQTSAGRFADVTAAARMDLRNPSHFGALGDVDDDGRLDLVVQTGGYQLPGRVFDLGQLPLRDITGALGLRNVRPARDIVIADLNNDGRNDVFLTGNTANSDWSVDGRVVQARMQPKDEQSLAIGTSGDMSFKLQPAYKIQKLGFNRVFIGSGGKHPSGTKFTLSAADPSNAGIVAHKPGTDRGIYIGYDRSAHRWRISYSAAGGTFLVFTMTSSADVGAVSAAGFDDTSSPDTYLVNSGGRYVDRTGASGITANAGDINATAADFDNDGHLDLYVVRTGAISNKPNVLYHNNGNGTFSAVTGAGGAAGSAQGQGDVAAAADYDLDGRMDLYLTNGRKLGVGPDQLFRNTTANGNHWLELDLQGVRSNRWGVGAVVTASAGSLQMKREQTTGQHEHGAQNFQRLHFGLGAAAKADLVIRWPSGAVQRIAGVSGDQVIRATEPVGGGTGRACTELQRGSGAALPDRCAIPGG